MLAGELSARVNKLEREVRERSEAERRRREKERIAIERQRARERAREEERRARRLAVLAAEAAEQERREAETEANRGVYFRATLRAAPAAPPAAERGIRRAADKLLLPASVGASLMAQEAYKNGAMLFEVAAPNGARTHAGVLEFSPAVPEGVVLLPEKVVNCLWGPPSAAARTGSSGGGEGGEGIEGSGGGSGGGGIDASDAEQQQQQQQQQQSQRCAGSVRVSYRRLEKGTYVRLQPELRRFHETVGADPEAMKAALEAALTAVSTLTIGDWVDVPFDGEPEPFRMRVLDLEPAHAVSVIDTDIACDVGPSIETEGYLRAREEAAAREAERLRQLQEQRDADAARALAESEAAAATAAAAEADDAARRLRVRASKQAALPPEPTVDEPAATCAFRLPDGGRLQRRFRPGDLVAALFDFVDSQGAGGLEPGSYRLVASFPRRVIEPPPVAEGADAGKGGGMTTLAEAGVAAGESIALLLESRVT